MNNSKLMVFKIAIVAVLTTAFASCKKKEIIEEQKIVDKVNIVELKKYYSQLTQVDTSKIYFDAKENGFFIGGKKQIGYQELKKMSTDFPNVEYKDGKQLNK